MRKLVVSTMTSLDGYVAGPGGDLSVLGIDEFFNVHNRDLLKASDVLLAGARCFRDFLSYGPAQAADPDGDPLQHEIGLINTAIRKVVVSDSLRPADVEPWADTTTIVPRADARAALAALKQEPGGDIVTFGGRTLFNDLLAAGLVDELHVMVGASVAGGGTPAFDAAPPLRLLDVARSAGSSSVVLHYAVG